MTQQTIIAPELLARELGIPVRVIHILATHGYLRTARRTNHVGAGDSGIVKHIIRDHTGTIHWPVIQLHRVCKLLPDRPSVKAVKTWCDEQKIRVAYDPNLGYVMSYWGLRKLLTILGVIKYPRVIDRISIILWLLGMETPNPRAVPKFDLYIEKEIRRVRGLKEPYKTEQAVKLLLRFRDAGEIARVIGKAKMGDLAKVVNGDGKYTKQLRIMAGLRNI